MSGKPAPLGDRGAAPGDPVTELPRSARAVVDAGDRLGVDVEIRRFPAGTRTARDAARAIGCPLGAIVKSLVFVAGDRAVLALTSGANRIDEARLAVAVGGRPVRKATAEEVRAATGFAIGGTPPFGGPSDLIVVVDPALTEFDVVWAAAGTPEHVFPIRPADLIRVTGGMVAGIAAEPASE